MEFLAGVIFVLFVEAIAYRILRDKYDIKKKSGGGGSTGSGTKIK